MVTLTKTNDIIRHFLNCSNSFSKEVQTRLKLSSYIKEFDTKLNKNVSLFASLSNARYKSVKSGNKLDTVLTNQKGKYSHLSHEIITDGFYNNEDIRKEKDKIKKNITNAAKATMINKIRSKIKILTKPNDSLKNMFQSKSPRTTQRLQNPINRLGTNNQFLLLKKRTISEKPRASEGIDNNPNKDEDQLDDNSREAARASNLQLLFNFVEDDNKVMNNQFNEYRNYLNSVKEDLQQKGKEERRSGDYNDSDSSQRQKTKGKPNKTDPKLFFSSGKFKMLSFNETKKVEVKEKPVDISIDLQKIFKYTKQGKRATWGMNQLMTPTQMVKTNESQKMQSTFFSYPNEKCNTMNKVTLQAKSFMQIEDKFNKKRARLKHLFEGKKQKLPRLSSYSLSFNSDNYPLNASDNIKTTKSLLFSSKSIQNNTNMSNADLNKSIPPKESLKPIYNTFEGIYNKKNSDWNKEDSERKLNTQRPTQAELETIHTFLVNINKLPRATQLYIDNYSYRNKDNELITNFSRSLGNTFYDKKSLNRLIKGYLIQRDKAKGKGSPIHSFRSKYRRKTKKEQLKEDQIVRTSKIHVPKDFKFALNGEIGNMSEGELGKERDYVPPYLRVKEKDEMSNDYQEQLKFRKMIEDKHKTKEKNVKRTIEVNERINPHLKRRASMSLLDFSQHPVLKTPKNNIEQNKMQRKNSINYPSSFNFKLTLPSQNYFLNEFVLNKFA